VWITNAVATQPADLLAEPGGPAPVSAARNRDVARIAHHSLRRRQQQELQRDNWWIHLLAQSRAQLADGSLL
jgi:hypothetical protein